MASKINNQLKQKLQQLWNEQGLNANAKIISENHIDEYNDSIIKQIINGDLKLSNREIPVKNIKSKFEIDTSVQDQILRRAEKQKTELENKLGYLNHSINIIKLNEAKTSSSRRRYLNLNQSTDDRLININTQRASENSTNFKQIMQQRQRKIEQMKKEAKLRQELKQSERLEVQERKKFEEQQKKKKQIYESINKIKERMQKREVQIKDGNQKIKELLNKQNLYQKLQQNYQKFSHSLLEERKKKLSQIRNLYKPIDHQELINHEQRFMQLKKEKDEIRQRERRLNSQKTSEYEIPYESIFYRKIKQQQEDLNADQQKIKIDKIKLFSSHVKDNFKPQVSARKKKQIQEIKKKEIQDIKLKQQKEKQLKQKARSKGLQYLKQLKNFPRPSVPTVKTPNQSSPRNNYKNYLTHSQRTTPNINPWNKILSSNDNQEKALKVYYQSMRIQENLRRKEELTRVLKKKDCQQIDQGYYQMIKAKLQVLQKHV